jgi:DNA-binding response OmpR family regulator
MLLKVNNILVVDDVILMCDFLYGLAVRIPNTKVFKALDGKTAAEILEQECIDLVITDIEIKSPTGIQLVYKIRSHAFTSTAYDIPIIIFSGNTYLNFINQCMQLDVNDFIAKPSSVTRLQEKINHHLNNKKVIKDAEFYSSLGEKLFKNEKDGKDEKRRSVSIVMDLPESDEEEKTSNVGNKVKKDFLHWPDDVTTGYFAIDRRLRNLAFNISCFHNVFINNCKAVAIESERKRAITAVDYLLHITKNIKQKESRPEFWPSFNKKLSELNMLSTQLQQLDLRHHNAVIALLKRISYCWMQIMSRPIVSKKNEHD